jgi:hypothetical protein
VSGSGDTDACERPQADCDESIFTGCEANLLTDLAHCGACGAYCHGICADGECQEFEVLTYDGPFAVDHGIAMLPNEFQTELYALGDVLTRWSEKTGATTVLNQGDLVGLLTGVDQVYALTAAPDYRVLTLPLSGGSLATTELTALAALVHDGFYAVDAEGMPYRAADAAGARQDLPLPRAPEAYARFDWVAGFDSLPVLFESAADVLDATGYSYRAYQLETDGEAYQWKLLTEGSGRVHQVRSTPSWYVLFDLRLDADERDEDDPEAKHELRLITADGTTRKLHSLRGVVSFELDWNVLYVSRRLPDERDRASVLTVFSLSAPERIREFATDSGMSSLTLSGSHFYFGATSQYALLRFPSWLDLGN